MMSPYLLHSMGLLRVADIRWGGVNLAVIAWENVMVKGLGDEQAAWNWKPKPLKAYKPHPLSPDQRALTHGVRGG